MSHPRRSSSLLIDEEPLQVLPSLAKAIGLNEALFLQQVHYWTRRSGKTVNGQEGLWIYNTAEEWQRQLPFWSVKTIRRTSNSLKEKNLLHIGRFNKVNTDQTLWYSVNYEELAKYEFPSGQNGQLEVDKMTTSSGQNDHMTSGQNDHMLPEKRITTEKREAAPKTQRAKPEMQPQHPAVVIYRETYNRNPNKQQIAALSELPTDELSLKRWRNVLSEWALNGWNPASIGKMLDKYQKGVAPPSPVTTKAAPKDGDTRTIDGRKQQYYAGAWYDANRIRGAS